MIMTQKLKFSSLLLMAGLLTITSCKKEENIEPENGNVVSGTTTINASAYDKWVYFSFKENQVVSINDFTNSLDWDIGFHRHNVRLNCGASGIGQGGTYDAGKVDFDSVIEAPETGYALNDSIQIMEKFEMPPVYVTVPGDTIIANWLSITYGQGGPQYDYSNNIYVIRTADGKYAKIFLKNYFNDLGDSGHVTMKYAYQPDGSRELE